MEPVNKKQKFVKEYPQLLQYHKIPDLYTPEIYKKFNFIEKHSRVKIKGHFTKNTIYYVEQELNMLFIYLLKKKE